MPPFLSNDPFDTLIKNYQTETKKKMSMTEYTTKEMRSLLKNMSGMYDLVRVVDPIECRILSFQEDGTVSMNETCYGIWNAGQKCVNCSSALACRTGCHQEKAEHFQDRVFHIQSNPIRLKLPDGAAYDAVVELVSVVDEAGSAEQANDRAAENVNHAAAEYQAIHDEVTGVLKAGAFYELARGMIVRNPQLSWVMISGNIMNFRLVNTLFGVLKGNEVLVRTAVMLQKIAEDAGGLCGRLGSDKACDLFLRSSSAKAATDFIWLGFAYWFSWKMTKNTQNISRYAVYRNYQFFYSIPHSPDNARVFADRCPFMCIG